MEDFISLYCDLTKFIKNKFTFSLSLHQIKMNLISIKNLLLFISFTLVMSCATYKKQISRHFKNWNVNKTSSKEVSNIYLIGDAGDLAAGNKTLEKLQKELQQENENSTVIFLGDNVYPKGINPKKGISQKDGIAKLNAQLNILKNYKGNTIFIPGNHDWYYGLDGLKKQEKLVEDSLGKNTFLPENGCPLEVVHLNKEVDVIIIDSQWYITDWNKHPKMNDKCDEIKTREKFFVELEGLINKSQNKITLIAIHHPLTSKGTHAGENSFKKHIFPFSNNIPMPIVGSIFQTIRKTSGLNPQDLNAYRYNELTKRVSTLAKEHSHLIFVSGHEHNLQYLFKDGIPQIISGAGSKTSPTYLGKEKGFTYGKNGYAKLSIYPKKHVDVTFKNNEGTIFKTTVFKPEHKKKDTLYNKSIKPYATTSIYPKSLTDKSKFYTALWGHHYRKEYSTLVRAKTVMLDTLYGGLTLVKKGGGHQSKSLRLINPEGKQYVMRALKKSAVRFLQTVAFKNDYVTNDLKDTYTENILFDFYTSAHPYTPFIIGDLSDAIKVYHTNPKLFYVPKQKTIAPHNDEFGDALYMIEERPEDGHNDLASFGFPDDIISTDDLFAKLRDSKNNKLDERNYVTARLFDMILGDWDRHVDQWRWAEFKNGKQKLFRPIPRDRDQAFSNYDGFILKTLTTLIDPIKLMQTYDKDIRNLYKFNDEPYPIDVSLLQESDYSIWQEQAKYIKENLTDNVINKAFEHLPETVKNENINNIKNVLKYRRDHVVDIAKQYQKILEKFAIIKGTDNSNYFEISANKETTTVKVYDLKKDKIGEHYFTRKFSNNNTKEIWIYGLDHDNLFHVLNTDAKSPKIRLIGGQNKDTYHVEKSAKKVRVHDFSSKKNIFKGPLKKHLTDRYDNNIYEFRKVKDYTQTITPLIGYNPDDGLAIGASFNRTFYGYNRQPFSNKHVFNLKYYSATQGFDFSHRSEFATYLNHWNVFVKSRLTSSNFSNNFFGFGNNTVNHDDDLGLDYNRVKSEIKSIEPGVTWNNLMGASFNISIPLTIYELEEMEDRYLNTLPVEFDEQNFAGIKTSLHYNNYNSNALPILGFDFNLTTGWDYNLSKNSSLAYLKTDWGMLVPISLNKKWALSSKIRSQFNFGDDFQLYQSAFIGGNNGLRGYRNERFSGKQSFVQNTNLRYTINNVKTPVLPLTYGVSLGYDYGRVWLPNEESDRWHTSYGTTLWFSAPLAKINFNLFNSTEGLRFTFGVGVNW
ncbi:metallophosphoesterase [Wenyingzhuangia sp. IMCC45467]